MNIMDSNKDIRFAIKMLFDEVKEELTDHRESINQNTNEITSNYEFLSEIDYKINKLSERIDKIQLFLEQNSDFQGDTKPKFNCKPLSNNEQDVFLVLYTLEDKKGTVSYSDIAKRTGLSEDLVSSYITRMIEKNIPIIKRYVNNQPLLRLDPQFKRVQAKENILEINQRTIGNY